MAAEKLWLKVEPFLWYVDSIVMFWLVYAVIVYRARVLDWPFWSTVLTFAAIGFWWTGFKSRLATFLRESLRAMVAEELAQSRVAFVSWLREDAPWRGENPFTTEP